MSRENSAVHSTDKRLVAVRVAILAAFAALLLYGSTDLPYRGDPDNRMHSEESITGTPVAGNYYVREAYHDAHTPNMVTVILGDYRGVDTLGEQVVVFSAGLICLLILRVIRDGDNDRGSAAGNVEPYGTGQVGTRGPVNDAGNNRGGQAGPDTDSPDHGDNPTTPV